MKNFISVLIVVISIFWSGFLIGQESVNKYDTSISDSKTMSATEALLWLDEGIYSHQYYLDHPESQNYGTGDSDYQIKTILQYQRLKELLKQLTR